MVNTWSDTETQLLVTLWSDANVQGQLENHSIRNNVVFEKLAKGMLDSGFQRNGKQCQSKIKHLKEKYRNYKDKVARSGAGGARSPKFFGEIDEVLGNKPQTRPTFLLDSGNFEVDENTVLDAECYDVESPSSESNCKYKINIFARVSAETFTYVLPTVFLLIALVSRSDANEEKESNGTGKFFCAVNFMCSFSFLI